MNIASLIGTKINQTQGFLEDGTRVPLSVISLGGNVVTQIKTNENEGYNSVQLGFGNKRKTTKPMAGHIKKAGIDKTPRFFREIRIEEASDLTAGQAVSVEEVFELGDIVDVTGTSKGKGYAGVVKKWGFAGGPRTHGQSDRERARGSSGSGTTPGRVYKGKKMSGRMGNAQVTVKNLEVLGIEGDSLFIRGLVPGAKGSVVVIKKVGKNKKFTPLFSDKKEEEIQEQPVEEVKVETAEEKVEAPEEKIETPEEIVETAEEKVEEAKEPAQEEKKEEIEEEAK